MALEQYRLQTSIPQYGMRSVELHLQPLENSNLTARMFAKIGTESVPFELEGSSSKENGIDVIRLLMYKNQATKASHMLVLRQQSAGDSLTGFYEGTLISFISGEQKHRQRSIPSIDDLVILEKKALEYDRQPTTFVAALTKN